MPKYNVHGAQLQISNGAPSPTFTTVAQLETLTLPSETRGSEDVPTHDQAVGSVASKIVDALLSIGELPFTVIQDWADASHDQTTGLYSLLRATAETDFRIILADGPPGTQIDVTGWLVGYTPEAMPANRGVARTGYAIQATGLPTIT